MELKRQSITTNAGDENIPEFSDERNTLYTRNLVKTYGKRTVANNVSISVRQGEIVGLLGPNGAGKTTSFYMTTGLVVPNSGQVFINDEEITKDPVSSRAKKGVGYLAQEASVFRTMSVEDNIMTVLEMKYKSIEEQREHLERLLDEFNLQKVRKNRGNQLSGGERRRCEIARCLAIDPKFIMLDEPFAGVDPIAVEDIQYVVWKQCAGDALHYRPRLSAVRRSHPLQGYTRRTCQQRHREREVPRQQLRAPTQRFPDD